MRKNNFALLFLLVCLTATVFSIFSSLDSPTVLQFIPTAQAQEEVALPSTVGIAGTAFNWTEFWQKFKEYASWELEWLNGNMWQSVKSDLTVIRRFPEPNHCKISLIFDASHTGSYRLTFAINRIVKEYVAKIDKFQYELDYDDIIITFDWSDCVSISGLQFTHGVIGNNFWFRIRRDRVPLRAHVEIDPSTVATSAASLATSFPFQRKSFYANGRFWVFYSSGTNMVYCTSTDGTTWTSATTVRAASYGYRFSIWFDETYLHYAYAAGTLLYYRRGTPNSDGTITWSAVEQTVSTTYNRANFPSISVDSSGYMWIGYRDYSSIDVEYYPCVIKSGNNNGTWGTSTIYQLSITDSVNWRASVISLTSNKMLAIYAYDGTTIKSQRWTGSAWGTERVTTSNVYIGYYFCAVAQGDDVHLVFLKSTGYNVLYCKYTYASDSWGAETTVQAGATSSSAPALSIDTNTNNLYCFWAGYPTANTIYCKKYVSSWTYYGDNITEGALTGNDLLTSTYNSVGNIIGLEYMNKTSSPYQIRYAYIVVAVQHNLNLRVMDWDLADGISGAVVTMNNGTENVKISDGGGWANYTGVSGSITVSVAYYGKTVNGTELTVTADTTLDLRCKLYDVIIKVMADSAVLCNANVTVYNSTTVENNKIRTDFTNQSGYARLVNLPNATLTVTIYDGVGNILANTSRSITVDEQTESISITQNYSAAQIPTLYILSYGTVIIFAKKRKGGENSTCK